ncbi:MAG TPA: tetratricopeptide repeat protein [Thermoanaerobaculia bacterium]|nr:tetratricopeptide repeat protein [Thermoanaerobaculia bacterium]
MRAARRLLALAFAAALAPAALGAADKKPTPEPFYRKYLAPGDPLDDKIIEQEKRVEANPQDASLRNDFGNLLAERRFPAQAAEQYEIALKLDAKNFISAYNLGLVRETEGKFSEAISAYKRSIKRKPGFPQSRFRLGRLYEHANEPEQAVHEYAEAMWIDPAMRDPKRNPLIVDCQLIYLASLKNYRRDVAVSAMTESNVYFDNDRFRKLPTNRAIGSKEVENPEEAESPGPRDVGAPPGSGGSTGTSEPARHTQRPVPGGAAGAPGQRPNTLAPGVRRPPLSPRPAAAAPAPATTPAPAAGEPAEGAPEAPPEPAPEPAPEPGADIEPS